MQLAQFGGRQNCSSLCNVRSAMKPSLPSLSGRQGLREFFGGLWLRVSGNVHDAPYSCPSSGQVSSSGHIGVPKTLGGVGLGISVD